jgi:hypothetical protein
MPKYPEFKSKPIISLEEEDWGKLSTGRFNRSINFDWEAKVANTNYEAFQDKRITNTDFKAFQDKRVANTDYKARDAKIDWKAKAANTNWKQKVANTDYKARNEKIDWEAKVANTNYKARNEKIDWETRNKKLSKPVSQYDKEGNWIKDWEGAKQACIALGMAITCVTMCLKGKQKTAGGFVWKYKDQ